MNTLLDRVVNPQAKEGLEVNSRGMNISRLLAVSSLFQWVSTHLLRNQKEKPIFWMKVSNLTRQVVLAHYVEVADRGATRRKGLLGRDSLPDGEGLWIVPCESVHTFGMKFPIDLLYLDHNRKVKKIRHSMPPWRVSACLSAHSVIELSSGTIQKTQTQPGDKIELFDVGTSENLVKHRA
jgi:uncharacterized membrane protein (UPF0127 family)